MMTSNEMRNILIENFGVAEKPKKNGAVEGFKIKVPGVGEFMYAYQSGMDIFAFTEINRKAGFRTLSCGDLSYIINVAHRLTGVELVYKRRYLKEEQGDSDGEG